MPRPPLVVCLALCLCTTTVPAADDVWPPASEWRSYCQAYQKALEGDAAGNDLDVTYCLGVTKGLLTGMQIGSQLGALSFGSHLAVQYKLDPDEVFKRFQTYDQGHLLGICSPASSTTPDYVRAVLGHLEKNPDDLKRPIAEVFYEALAATYPCS